jgi:signal recognition particle subunit SRP19
MASSRITEIEDASDPEEMEIDDAAFDFARPQGTLQPTMDPSAAQMTPEAIQAMFQSQQYQPQQGRPGVPQQPQMTEQQRQQMQREAQERTKNFQCLYPVYFDSMRSREQGRRVKKEEAVPNPLAREIVDAVSHVASTMGLPMQIVFEPHKSHPKDWGNPGRVRVLVKKDGKAISAKVANSAYHIDALVGCKDR